MSAISFFEKLQSLRNLACVVYDRAVASGASQEEVNQAVGPVQIEYEDTMRKGIEGGVDEVATAIEMFEAMAEAQAKHAADIMEKAKDLRTQANRLRNELAASMDYRNETARAGTLYNASLVDGIGQGGQRRRQLVLR